MTIVQKEHGLTFTFGDHEIRVMMRGATPWFVLSDVAQALGIKNTGNIVKRLKPTQVDSIRLMDVNRGNPVRKIISESALYLTALRSDSPDAVPFQEWVTEVVIPEIRTEGGYSVPTLTPALPPQPDFSALERLAGITAQAIEVRVEAKAEEVKAELRAEIDEKIGALPITSEQRWEIRTLVGEIVSRRKELNLGRSHWGHVYKEFYDACRIGNLDVMTREQFPKAKTYLTAELGALGAMSRAGLFGEQQAVRE